MFINPRSNTCFCPDHLLLLLSRPFFFNTTNLQVSLIWIDLSFLNQLWRDPWQIHIQNGWQAPENSSDQWPDLSIVAVMRSTKHDKSTFPLVIFTSSECLTLNVKGAASSVILTNHVADADWTSHTGVLTEQCFCAWTVFWSLMNVVKESKPGECIVL